MPEDARPATLQSSNKVCATLLGAVACMLASAQSGAASALPTLSFSATPTTIRRGAPALGEHTDEVLGDIGYTAQQIAGLRTEGAAG